MVKNQSFMKSYLDWGYKMWEDGVDYCLLCGREYLVGVDGNELGFCEVCQKSEDFPYDLDRYYEDYDKGRVVFKGFDTMSRGLLERYRK